MLDILQSAGFFVYPLGLCSLLAIFIIFERLIALRSCNVMPASYVEAFVEGKIPPVNSFENSVGNGLLVFYRDNKPDPDALKAYAQLQVTHLERGLFILDIVVAAAPLLGLLGTVAGLIQVFSNISLETGMPEPSVFIQGIALALTTTLLGLAIAIPALVGSRYLYRRIEKFTAQIGVALERLIDLSKENEIAQKSS